MDHATPIVLDLDPDFTPVRNCLSFSTSTHHALRTFDFPSTIEPHIAVQGDDGGHLPLFDADGSPTGTTFDTEATEQNRAASVILTTRLRQGNDLLRLFLATDIVRAWGVESIGAVIPYLPFARQDRRTSRLEPFSLKVLAGLINAQNYRSVHVFDPHSDGAEATVDRLVPHSNRTLAWHAWNSVAQRNGVSPEEVIIISPDAGAYKKIFKTFSRQNASEPLADIAVCSKVRDTSTGALSGTRVDRESLDGRPCLIVDDICDGGGTFVLLAEELRRRGAGSVSLVVSHGIFSKGTGVFNGLIDTIHTTNSFAPLFPRDGTVIVETRPLTIALR